MNISFLAISPHSEREENEQISYYVMHYHQDGIPSPLVHKQCGIYRMKIKPCFCHIQHVNVLRDGHSFVPSCR